MHMVSFNANRVVHHHLQWLQRTAKHLPLQTARKSNQTVIPCRFTVDVSHSISRTGAIQIRFNNPMKPKKVVTSAYSSFGSILRIAVVYAA